MNYATLSAGPRQHLLSNGWFFSAFFMLWRVTVSTYSRPAAGTPVVPPAGLSYRCWSLVWCARAEPRRLSMLIIVLSFCAHSFCLVTGTWCKDKVTFMQVVAWRRSAPPVAFCGLGPRCYPDTARLQCHFPVLQCGNGANVKCFPWHRERCKISSRYSGNCVSLRTRD